MGCALGGWSLHIVDGKIRYVHNLYGKQRDTIESAEPITPGEHRIEYVFTKDEGLGGVGVLSCDGHEVGRGAVPRFTPSGFNGVGAGLTCGYEWGPAIGTGYTAPFPFPGRIHRALVETRGPVVRDPAGRARGDSLRAVTCSGARAVVSVIAFLFRWGAFRWGAAAVPVRHPVPGRSGRRGTATRRRPAPTGRRPRRRPR